MSWDHICRRPGDFSIWLHRAHTGSRWKCDTCGRWYVLGTSADGTQWRWREET